MQIQRRQTLKREPITDCHHLLNPGLGPTADPLLPKVQQPGPNTCVRSREKLVIVGDEQVCPFHLRKTASWLDDPWRRRNRLLDLHERAVTQDGVLDVETSKSSQMTSQQTKKI